MQEFLALNTDARIAFVKKPFIVSRIDKVRSLIFDYGRTQYSLHAYFTYSTCSVILPVCVAMPFVRDLYLGWTWVRNPERVSFCAQIVVNAIVDTLKTAFPRSEPQSPTEDNDGEVDGGKISGDKKSRYDRHPTKGVVTQDHEDQSEAASKPRNDLVQTSVLALFQI